MRIENRRQSDMIPDSTSGTIAQLVERGIHKPKVPGSSPGGAIQRRAAVGIAVGINVG
jgi:hypothetical protein